MKLYHITYYTNRALGATKIKVVANYEEEAIEKVKKHEIENITNIKVTKTENVLI